MKKIISFFRAIFLWFRPSKSEESSEYQKRHHVSKGRVRLTEKQKLEKRYQNYGLRAWDFTTPDGDPKKIYALNERNFLRKLNRFRNNDKSIPVF